MSSPSDNTIRDFEAAIAELESIVKKLEDGDLSLEQSLALSRAASEAAQDPASAADSSVAESSNLSVTPSAPQASGPAVPSGQAEFAAEAMKKYGLDPEKPNPVTV